MSTLAVTPVDIDQPRPETDRTLVSAVPALYPEDTANECKVMPIRSLLPADSPRLSGEDLNHAQLLAESAEELPAILVHGKTRRVIDGMHRLRAAILRGEETIRVRLFEGSDEAAFVLAVRANVVHGLPLSLADREAAAARILRANPTWSDRVVASIAGISPKTVSAIRRQVAANVRDVQARIGRDGRVRPLNCDEGRRRAGELFAMRPDASLREVARESGVSLGTARDVRQRVRRGEDPIPSRQSGNRPHREPNTREQQLRRTMSATRIDQTRDRDTILNNLRRDPSVRFTESGRGLLRWLESHATGVDGWERFADLLAPHCAYVIADLACAVAEEWLEVAEQLRQRAEAAS